MTVILSACYSASFADTLSCENRNLLTAAAAKRNSFGCNDQSKNTWSIAQHLAPHFNPENTCSEVFVATHDGVEFQEQVQKTSHHSNPQMRSLETLKKNTLAHWYSSRHSPMSLLQTIQK
jgi:hypothetical protein